jgi:translation initiation factor 6 (eIF-6)
MATKTLDAQMSIDEIREVLTRTVRQLDIGDSSPASANAISNAVGKMLSSAKLQMEYARFTNRKTTIALLETGRESTQG